LARFGTNDNCAMAIWLAHSKKPSAKAAFPPHNVTPQLSHPHTADAPRAHKL
jgi:hypothetical protein